MNKVFMFLVSLFLLSCSKKNEFKESISINENISFIKNDTIKHIIDRIIEENEPFQFLQFNLLDTKGYPVILVQIDDIITECNEVQGLFHYKDKIIIVQDLSDYGDFNLLFDFSKDNFLEECNQYEIDFEGKNDPISYPFRITKEGNLMYPNGDTLIYNEGKLKLNFWK